MKSLQQSEIVPLGVYISIRGSGLLTFGKNGRNGAGLKGVMNWAMNLKDRPALVVNIAHEVGSESALVCADLAISLLYRKGKGLRFIIASADPAVIAHIKGLYRDVETALILRGESDNVLRSMPLKDYQTLGYRHLIIENLASEENSDGFAEFAEYARVSHGVQVWVITGTLIAFAATLVDKKVGVISECPMQIAQCVLNG